MVTEIGEKIKNMFCKITRQGTYKNHKKMKVGIFLTFGFNYDTFKQSKNNTTLFENTRF